MQQFTTQTWSGSPGWQITPVNDGKCSVCRKRDGVHRWSEGVIASLHGCTELRCSQCAYKAQLVHATSRAVRIPALAYRLMLAVVTGKMKQRQQTSLAPKWALIVAAVAICLGIIFGALPALEHSSHPDCLNALGFVCH